MNVKQSPILLAQLTCLLVVSSRCIAQSTETGVLGDGKPWATPIYIVDSGVAGPTVVITGGIHGNEPAGARSAEQIRHWPIRRGKLIVVPRVNVSGLKQNKRFIPQASENQQDLNRNFPSPGIADEPRGEIAVALWDLLVRQPPDWLFDLHEGHAFNVSHKPKPGRKKSVGSSIIYDRNQQLGPMAERMLAVVNSKVSEPDRMFVLLSRGPNKTSLAGAVINVLKKRAMILETTYKNQPLSVRTRQHLAMMAEALFQLEMIDQKPEELIVNREAKEASVTD